MTRQLAKNGYYTRRYTSNIIAVIDGIGYIVAYIPNRKTGLKDRVIMNERVIFSDSFITSEEFVYEPFADKKS